MISSVSAGFELLQLNLDVGLLAREFVFLLQVVGESVEFDSLARFDDFLDVVFDLLDEISVE